MEGTYKKGKGNAGLDGVQFQINLATVFLLNALRNLKGWRISTENEAAGKFDDVVLELSDGSAVLLQAKHKDSKRVTRENLLSDNSRNAEFSLPKYFFSHEEIKAKFKVKNVIICTNTDVDINKIKDISNIQSAHEDNILHFEGNDCSFIKFNQNILPILKANIEIYYDKNLQDKSIDRGVITDENLRVFIEKLQFFTRYPSGGNLHKVIEQLLFRLKDRKLLSEISSQEICKKVEDWFKQSRADYITEISAIAMFCEIRSDKYRNMLKNCNVLFERNSLRFEDAKRIFRVTTNGRYFLTLLKTHNALKNKEKKTLYVDPNDGSEVQNLSIEAFSLPKYEYLVLVYAKDIAKADVSRKLKQMLDKHHYKKVILLSNRKEELIQIEDIFEVDGTVTFNDFTQDTRERLIRVQNINFQGEVTTLNELLESSSMEYCSKALDSDIIEKLVRFEKVKVGEPLLCLDEDTARYYIDRTFEREVTKKENKGITKEDKMYMFHAETDDETDISKGKEYFREENIFYVNKKVILISDTAGMGKSTVLAKLAVDIKQKSRKKWVIRIELNNYTIFLREVLRKKNKDVIKVTDFLNSKEATKLTNHLEKFVFSMEKKVVIMFDAFDEISPVYTEHILNLLSQCRNDPNFEKIIVTTRPHLTAKLKATLETEPFVLRPLTKQDQVDFLTIFWMHNLNVDKKNIGKLKKYATVLIDRMSVWVNKENNFAAIPLQVRMLAEIFQCSIGSDFSANWKGCKEFLCVKDAEPDLPDKMNVTNLYDMFVERKFDALIDKTSGNVTLNDLLTCHFNEYFINHQSLALNVILGKENNIDPKINKLFGRYQYKNTMETNMLRIGIVQKSNGKLEFIHRTFAEYFLAKSILEVSELHLHSFSSDEVFQRFMVEEILCNPELTVVRAFIDSFIESIVDKLPSNVFQQYQSSKSYDWHSTIYRANLIHLLSQEGCVAILRLLLKSVRFNSKRVPQRNATELIYTDVNKNHNEFNNIECTSNILNYLQYLVELGGINIRNDSRETPLHLAAQAGHLEMVKLLVDLGASVDAKQGVGYTALHLAAKAGHLNVLKHLTKCKADINAVNVNGFSALHCAVAEGSSNVNVVKFLVLCGIDVNIRSNMGNTALFFASGSDVIKLLVKSGVDVNAANNGGYTALHVAAKLGNSNDVKCLIESGIGVDNKCTHGFTSLLMAVLEDNLEMVKTLIKFGADVNAADNDGNTALHLAAQECHSGVVRCLIESGVAVDNRSIKDCTPLLIAAYKGNLDVVKTLVGFGADVNAADNDGNTALHIAAKLSNPDVVKCLIECGLGVDNRSNSGLTPLLMAALEGHLEVVKTLMKFGADVNAADNNGNTALHLAAQEGHSDAVRCLIESGVDVDNRNSKGLTPLLMAAFEGHLDVVKTLVNFGADVNATSNNCNIDGFTSLLIAASQGNLDVVKTLVEFGADVNAVSKGHNSALHAAVQAHHMDIVKYLVEHGIDLNIRDSDNNTALSYASAMGDLDAVKYLVVAGMDINAEASATLHEAAGKGHLDVVKYFIECGVDVDLKASDGSTVLQIAAWNGQLDVVRYLMQVGADVKSRNVNGATALHAAAAGGHVDTVKFCVQCGIDVNIISNHNCTPIHAAVWNDRVDAIKCLVQCGADVNFVNTNGDTALHEAAERGHLDSVKFLLSVGVDVNLENCDGYTALGVASIKKHTAIIDLLEPLTNHR